MKVIIECDNLEELHTIIGNKPINDTATAFNKEMNSIKDKVTILKGEFESLIKEFSEIKASSLSENQSTVVDDVKETKKRNEHISTYKHYDNYKLPRQYNAEKKKFFVSENRPAIRLGFLELVAIIKAYKNGLPVKKMRTNPLLTNYSVYSLQHYIYIWRAGGFNQAIKDNARKFGYNPDKLISREVE